MLPLNTNIRMAYSNGKDDEQNFIQNLSLFLCTFLKEHGQLIEKRPNLRETLMEVHTFIYRGLDKFNRQKSYASEQSLNHSRGLSYSPTIPYAVGHGYFKIALHAFNSIGEYLSPPMLTLSVTLFRLSITCCLCQRWRRPRSSRSVWSTGTIWQLSYTERVRSAPPPHRCSLEASTLTCLHVDTSTCLYSPR